LHSQSSPLKSKVRFSIQDGEKNTVLENSQLRKSLEDICAAIQSAHESKLQLEILIDHEEKVWEMAMTPAKVAKTSSCQFTSLENLLSLSRPFSEKKWLHKEKAILAVVLAYSMLQLHESPWLSQSWSAKHIYFLENSSFSSSRLSATSQLKLRRPYVSTALELSSVRSSFAVIQPRNHCLIALGVVLLELYLNRTIREDDQELVSHDIRYMAIDLLEESADNFTMTPEYYKAIQFCLFPKPDPHSRKVSFDDVGFREIYYKEVIVQLEEHLRSRFETTDKIWDEV
jgi:hypothetical protein